MVLFAPRRIAKLLQRGRQEGRQEALQEYQTALTAWYERFKAARDSNQEFDEPPPFLTKNGGANS